MEHLKSLLIISIKTLIVWLLLYLIVSLSTGIFNVYLWDKGLQFLIGFITFISFVAQIIYNQLDKY